MVLFHMAINDPLNFWGFEDHLKEQVGINITKRMLIRVYSNHAPIIEKPCTIGQYLMPDDGFYHKALNFYLYDGIIA